MHRNPLRQLLATYPVTYPDDNVHLERVQHFVEQHPQCFERSLTIGHITGSAWIVSPDRLQVLLTHHKKLNRWLQLGGHADGNPDIPAVSLREAREESGLKNITLLSKEIFDIDVHPIPTTPTEVAHDHYDIRFIFEADPAEPLIISNESKDLAWVEIANLPHLSTDRSMLRMAQKTQARL
jgi:8-oxo-dGTP pyrophosphatase MutT (NUDIX family)